MDKLLVPDGGNTSDKPKTELDIKSAAADSAEEVKNPTPSAQSDSKPAEGKASEPVSGKVNPEVKPDESLAEVIRGKPRKKFKGKSKTNSTDKAVKKGLVKKKTKKDTSDVPKIEVTTPVAHKRASIKSGAKLAKNEGKLFKKSGVVPQDNSKGAAPKAMAKPPRKRKHEDGDSMWHGQEWEPGAWSADASAGAWSGAQAAMDNKWDKQSSTMSSSQVYTSGAKAWSGNKGHDAWGQHLRRGHSSW